MNVNSTQAPNLKEKAKSTKRERLPSPTKATQSNLNENSLTESESSTSPLMLVSQKLSDLKPGNSTSTPRISSDGSTQRKSRKKKEVEKHFTLKWRNDWLNLSSTTP